MKKYVLLQIYYLISQVCQAKNNQTEHGLPAITSVGQNQPCTRPAIIPM